MIKQQKLGPVLHIVSSLLFICQFSWASDKAKELTEILTSDDGYFHVSEDDQNKLPSTLSTILKNAVGKVDGIFRLNQTANPETEIFQILDKDGEASIQCKQMAKKVNVCSFSKLLNPYFSRNSLDTLVQKRLYQALSEGVNINDGEFQRMNGPIVTKSANNSSVSISYKGWNSSKTTIHKIECSSTLEMQINTCEIDISIEADRVVSEQILNWLETKSEMSEHLASLNKRFVKKEMTAFVSFKDLRPSSTLDTKIVPEYFQSYLINLGLDYGPNPPQIDRFWIGSRLLIQASRYPGAEGVEPKFSFYKYEETPSHLARISRGFKE